MDSVFIPVIGAVLDFDEHVATNEKGETLAIFRKLEWPGGLLAPGRIQKFYRDEYTLAYAELVSRSTFEIEYKVSSGTFEEHLAFVRIYLQLLMIKAGCRLAAPCHATHSLALIDLLEPKIIEITLSNPRDAHFHRQIQSSITSEMIDWTSKFVVGYVHQMSSQDRLSLAYHSLESERFAFSPSMSLLTLWSGLEALFSIDHEQTFRLSLMVAYYLERDPHARKVLFDDMRRAYGVRSAVTHGRKSKEDRSASVEWIAVILRRCIIRAVEIKSLPTTETLFFS